MPDKVKYKEIAKMLGVSLHEVQESFLEFFEAYNERTEEQKVIDRLNVKWRNR